MDLLLHLCSSFFFALYFAFTEYLVEEFFVEFSGNKAADFSYFEAEVTRVVLSFFLFNLQESCELSFITFVSSTGVEGQYLILLCVFEELLLVIALEVSRHQRNLLYDHTTFEGLTFFIQFSQRTTQDVAICVNVCAFRVTCLLTESVELLRNQLVRHLDVIVIYRITATNLSVEIRSQSDIKDKSEIILVLDILGLLLFATERFAQHIYLVFVDIIEEAILEQLVYFFSLSLYAIHLLHQAHRHLTLTETGHLNLLA
ncbi:hypothetical protein EVA_09624 [gut metagenome]|uniref:Uncharacterized protein n=1 Tax=gut metagenome TaxID=749906 RepID=J9G5W8_9ZZZZ